MAEGVFSISADIVPVLDERQLETQATVLVKRFNSLLAKEIKPIQLTASTKSLEQSQAVANRISNQFKTMDKDAGVLNRTLSATANVFETVAKSAAAVAVRGIRPILDGLQQIAPTATKAFGVIAALGRDAFDAARAGVLRFTNAINATNTSILGYAGNIRRAIQDNARFKDGLDFIKRSGDSLKSLPQTFADLQASVIAGVSPLQRAANAGSSIARSLTPFLLIGVAISRELGNVSKNIRTLVVDSGSLAQQFVPVKDRVTAAFASFGKDGPAAKKAVDDLKTAIPQLTTQLDQMVVAARGKGVIELKNSMKELRDEFVQTELKGKGLTGVIKRLFTDEDFTLAKAQLEELNRSLLKLGADRGEVPFFKRFNIAATDSFEFVEELIRKVSPKLAAIGGQVVTIGRTAATATAQVAGGVRTSGILAPPGPRTTQQTLPLVTPAASSIATVATATGAMAGKAILDGLKSTGDDFKFFFKTAFGGPAVITDLEAEGRLFGETIEKGVKEGVQNKNKEIANFLIPAGTKAQFDKAASDAVSSFQGGFERRLTGISGKGNLADALGLNTKAAAEEAKTSVSAVTAPVRGLISLLRGATGIVALPFKTIAGAARVATAPIGILKNVVGSALGDIGGLGLAAGGIGAAIIGIGTAALQTAARFETYRVAFEGLFGPGSGDRVIKLATEFDKLTHFSFETTIQSVEQLAGSIQGIRPEGALAILKQIGGAAAAVGASGDQVQRVVLAITQMSAAGRVTAQDLNQITQALPDISRSKVYDQIAKDLGVTNQAAKKLASEGLVSSEQGLAAVLEVAHDVPGATEAMKKQSQTFAGLMTIVQTNLKTLLVQIGGAILPTAKIVLEGLIIAFEKLGPVLKTVGSYIAGFFDVLTHIPIIGSIANRLINGMNKELHGTATAAVNAADGLQDAVDALDSFKNSAKAVQAAIPGAITNLIDLATKARLASQATAGIGAGLTAGAGSLGTAFDAIQAKLNSGFDFQKQANNLEILNDGVKQLANTHDINALSVGLDELQSFMNSLHLPADLQKTFDDFFSRGREKVSDFNVTFGETLKKVLASSAAYDANVAAQKAVTKAIQDRDDLLNEHVIQHDAEHLRLTKELTNAQDRQKESTAALADAQAHLDDVLKGASLEDLEKADLSLASAKLRLRQILEDEKKAQEALNASQHTGVDLTGLTLDQIKTRLSVARAALTAQKAVEGATTKKSDEQKSIDTQTAAIAKRDAELAVTDAIAAQNALKAKGLESDPEVIAARKAVAAASKADKDARDGAADAQTALNKLDGEDLAFKKQLQAANDGITASQEAAAKAASDYRISTLEAKGDQLGINAELEKQIKDKGPAVQKLLDDSLHSLEEKVRKEQDFGGTIDTTAGKLDVQNGKLDGSIDKYNTIIGKVVTLNALIANTPPAPNISEGIQKEITDALNAAFNKLKGTQIKFSTHGETFVVGSDGILKGTKTDTDVQHLSPQQILAALVQTKSSDSAINVINAKDFEAVINNPDILNAVTKALIDDPKSDLRKLFQELFKQLGFTLPGFAEGAVFNKATHGIFGEAGPEAILPLTRPMRMADIIGHPQVLPPVLAALDKISMPRISSEPVADLSGLRMVHSAPQIPDHHVQAKRDAALAKAIVAEMKSAGVSLGQTVVNNEFVAPDANDPLAKIHAAQIAREVKRQIEKLLG